MDIAQLSVSMAAQQTAQSIGIAAGVGFLLGLLVSRR